MGCQGSRSREMGMRLCRKAPTDIKSKDQIGPKIESWDLTSKEGGLKYRTNSGIFHPGPLGPENSPDL